MKKEIALGTDDFKKLIEGDFFYIDKTKFIQEVLCDGKEVKLFTRPRRFGKSLNMSMLNYFLNIENATENRKLFKDLYIENSPIFSEQGQYPVIFISMKEIIGETFEDLIDELNTEISQLFDSYNFSKEDFTTNDLKIYNEIVNGEKKKYKGTLKFLTKLLHKRYNKTVMLLIDEYDAPLLAAYRNGYYNKAVEFFRGFYGSVLKSNTNLKMGILTGITKIAQAGIFSGLNNIENYTILSEKYDEYFGLLESEVINALEYYEMQESLEEVKFWYDGYKFGNTEVYNPLSILKYMDSKVLEAYWVDTSEDFKLREYLETFGTNLTTDLENLINGDTLPVTITKHTSLGKSGKMSQREFWQLMLFSGYLTVEEPVLDGEYELRVPNEEVKSFFRDKFSEIIFENEDGLYNVKKALISKNIPALTAEFEKVLLQLPSYFDTAKNNENPYHMLYLGVIWGVKNYIVSSNTESGYGRPDLMLKAKNPNYPSYIFEFKIKDKENKIKNKDKLSLEKKAKIALKQIVDNKYNTSFIKEGIPKEKIVQIGFAFDGKKMTFYYEE